MASSNIKAAVNQNGIVVYRADMRDYRILGTLTGHWSSTERVLVCQYAILSVDYR